jgi:CBS domain-containing protein
MLVKELMNKEIVSVEAEDSIAKAAQHMKERDVGCLVVMSDGKPLGVVSDRDIVLRGTSKGLNPMLSNIVQVTSAGPLWCCYADHPLEYVADVMAEKKVRRLIVVDQKNDPVGMISLGDIAARGQSNELTGRVLQKICTQ